MNLIQIKGKKRKHEPLSKSAIRNQMNISKVKKSKRERSSRRGERDNERDSSRQRVFFLRKENPENRKLKDPSKSLKSKTP